MDFEELLAIAIAAAVVTIIVLIIVLVKISKKKKEKKELASLTEAAEKGGADDQINLGEFYLIRKKIPEAEQWFEKALKQGHIAAKSRLTVCLHAKRPDYKRYKIIDRQTHFSYMAEQGYVGSQHMLGSEYEYGFAIDVKEKEIHFFPVKQSDMVDAAFWYKKAAEQGYALGQASLGKFYVYGIGVEKDENLGFSLLLKAAENNESQAAREDARQSIEEASGMSYKEFVLKHK